MKIDNRRQRLLVGMWRSLFCAQCFMNLRLRSTWLSAYTTAPNRRQNSIHKVSAPACQLVYQKPTDIPPSIKIEQMIMFFGVR